MRLALLPAFIVFGLTIIISLMTGNPEDLFLAHSTSSVLAKFMLATPVLMIPIVILPRVLTYAGKIRNDQLFGLLVRSKGAPHHEFTISNDLLLRPFQGIALSLIFAARFIDFLEFSTGISYTGILIRSTVFAFLMVNPLISLFLSFVWTFDDLGVKVYNKRTDELRMLGRSIGVALPLITGVVGVFTLFHRTYFLDSLVDLVGTLMVLYPSYLLFVIFHHEFVRRRFTDFSQRLQFDKLETKVTHFNAQSLRNVEYE
jgi:hypothetical protein